MLEFLRPDLVCALIMLTQPGAGSDQRAIGAGAQRTDQPLDRVVKHLDFDERKLGNLESIPMRWVRHQAEGFPAYATGRFDHQVGYNAPPSFYLGLDGRSCAFHYLGMDLIAEPNSDYRVMVRIRPDGLEHARAYVSAYMLDANGQKLEGTERASRFVGGDPASMQWTEVSVRLPGNVEAAYSIGLTLWVVQKAQWWSGEQEVKHIDHKDVRGGAWFDDIIVYRLPTVELSSTAAERGNFYRSHEPVVILTQVGDASQRGLQARLIVRGMDGRNLYEEMIQGTGSAAGVVHRTELKELDSGAYQAELTVSMTEGVSIDRRMNFAVQPPGVPFTPKPKSRFGVVLDQEPSRNWQACSALLEVLGVGNVKIPLYRPRSEEGSADLLQLDAFIRKHADQDVLLTGILGGGLFRERDPQEARLHSLVDVFSSPPDTWRPAVADVVTKYEGLVRTWQFGRDGQVDIIEDARLPQVLSDLREQMSNLTNLPVLVSPWTTTRESQASSLPADILSLSIPVQAPPEEIPGHIDDPFAQSGFDEIWALLEVLPPETYERLPRLADYCKRLIFAAQSSADKIFVPQPWFSRTVATKVITEPEELLIIYGIISSVLTDTTYIGRLETNGDVECHAFDRRGQAVMALWDDQAPFEGEDQDLYLAGAERLVDIWGRIGPPVSSSTQTTVRLSPLPVFALGAETWLIQFRRDLRLEPALLSSAVNNGEQRLLITNPRGDPISGSIRLKEPEGWQIRPAQFSFAIQPGQTYSQSLRIQAAPREPAGPKQISAHVAIDASRLYEFEAKLNLQVGLADMDVWADLVLEGNAAIVRHRVTNRSNETVTLRSFADVPGCKRQNLNIIGLQPNQTIVKEHYFHDAGALSGKQVRVGLQQVKGPRSHNLSIVVP